MGTADRPLDEAIEEIVLGAPRRYTRLRMSEVAGLDLDEGRRLWRSLGFAEVADDAVLFTEHDIEAVRLMTGLTEAGVLELDVREAVARAVAQQMSRLAEWQVGLVKRLIESRSDDVTAQQALETTAAVLPALESLQTYVWRRHLAATVHRVLATSGAQEEAPDTWPLVVGFADMVGFTRTTRRRSSAELGEMIERFGSTTTEVIADGHGRIVKTVGDEVLFVADEIADGAAIALGLRDRARGEPLLPRLRIGLAAGPVLVRYGDVYGEVVNIASRLTTHADPDSVLVDRTVAQNLADDPRFTLRPLRPLTVRGYRHLHPWMIDNSS
ncbi:adenylate/guanylate cyclase domain-containing protein [Pseudonocardia alaniniphila]|uniref:Adenylate/guanylate cyclase domain-containing protein n=1 Tax=Pseudonocardia alaniniphila TaxID=75291 RepID=A0ABS9TGQ1_9PSEU|nr:adenylate/guanylate cyclase domain-containing protein [Pseudonocardia alaniniphila]MCH6167725.1 adenylate/guanylate cyclase domain-containing protein [Pseudonocardia alaniniphila]